MGNAKNKPQTKPKGEGAEMLCISIHENRFGDVYFSVNAYRDGFWEMVSVYNADERDLADLHLETGRPQYRAAVPLVSFS